jgi:hypothetical protein
MVCRCLGGGFAIGHTSNGLVAICTFRGRQIFLFDLEGRLLGQKACHRPPHEVGGHILQPYIGFPVSDIRLQPLGPVERPDVSLPAILLVPLWHPFVPWSIP